jgi:hypothetical protein
MALAIEDGGMSACVLSEDICCACLEGVSCVDCGVCCAGREVPRQ